MTVPPRFAMPPTTVPVTGSEQSFAVRRIYCVGRNYIAHIREMGEGSEKDPPFFFQKPTDAIVHNGGSVDYPPATDNLQYEVELVVAIGGAGRNLSVETGWSIIFGYAVGLDMTRRDRQFECRDLSRPWEAGKSFDQSAPCGAIRPFDEVGRLDAGALELKVNGATKQKSDLALMIWSVPEILANLSSQYLLQPGDLVFTGTPDGVGPVVPGDIIEAEVQQLPPLKIAIAEGR